MSRGPAPGRRPLNRWRFAVAIGIAVAFMVGNSAATVRAEGLVPHQALYQMSLESADSTSGISGARGAMLYRFADTCDGWTVETRTYLRLSYDQGDDVESTWSFITWESKDGLKYRYRVHQTRDGQPIEDIQGEAALDGPGGPGEARLSKPESTTVPLPAGTLFPTEHLVRLLQAAEKGERRFLKPMFDGASQEGPDLVSAFIVPVPPDRRAAQAKAAGLKMAPAWRMRLAFFPSGAKDAEPVFEIGVRYRADGIAEWILQDFGDFTLNLVPKKIDILPRPDC